MTSLVLTDRSQLTSDRKHLGGNQRELARQKNQKKLQEVQKKKGTGDKGMTLEQRKQRDADMMREKQQKAVNKTEGPAS
uniref:Small EDRK-rich factor-like N-terminal domain-containing protein n=1 Tax=Timema douglasi TaxID=61478 RepID=A0A7R8VHR5_TIMDO|nr:unnamed protein product [Timema douglasi]